MRIISRAQWGARQARGTTLIPVPQRDVFLHHTAGREPDGPVGVRAVQNFHMDFRDYWDIAYSFVVDRQGQVYEGRGAGVAGAHTSGHNSSSHAICVLGDYTHTDPSGATVQAVADLLKHGAAEGWWTSARLSGGHRDVGSTTCPGDRLYARIGDINRLAQTEEVPVDAMILVHPSTGTPDALASLTGIFMRPDQKVAVTCNVESLKDAQRSGKRTYAVGGPAADLVSGEKELRGTTRLDTLAKVLRQAERGW